MLHQGEGFSRAERNIKLSLYFHGQAIDLDGTQHTFFSNRSAAYLSMGEAENALADGESCIRVKPDWAKG